MNNIKLKNKRTFGIKNNSRGQIHTYVFTMPQKFFLEFAH